MAGGIDVGLVVGYWLLALGFWVPLETQVVK